ncbi:MAG TPA: endonuclease III [Candidatus Paceibacterota bacterium]|nr:endonuclease III [Candidatus Paceibacterota bacterium]
MIQKNNRLVKKTADIDRILKRLFPKAHMALKCRTPWECLVAVELSAQCTDKKVNEVTARLFKKYRSLDDYVHAKPAAFRNDIRSTGFYRNKTKNILAAAKLITSKFGGRVPRTMDELLTVPGVARKTANVVLGNVYGVVEGIAVDTHVRRLSRAWGLTGHTDPVKIERDLMSLLPKREWFAWTYRVIEYGRTYAPAIKKDHRGEPLERFYVR